jgi:hypothetical protein
VLICVFTIQKHGHRNHQGNIHGAGGTIPVNVAFISEISVDSFHGCEDKERKKFSVDEHPVRFEIGGNLPLFTSQESVFAQSNHQFI